MCRVCGRQDVEMVPGLNVCEKCWNIYDAVRQLVVNRAFCGGCAAWQKKMFAGETPQCQKCS
ncbi:hypothetical protein [Desulfotomaculum copahuensis]|uniref:hypothetical protein n=1 Tax=Desulfotomaculum copahuensis TaxID=1838280 RepID=UPI000AAA91BC|nr:hypothetical protein [Desulfotomaculum copahuensis]